MSGWRLALFWTIALAGLLVPSFLYDLRIPDEPRVAHTGLEMVRTGDVVLPTVNGSPFLQTPPLHYWALAGGYSLAGFLSDGMARVPSVLFSFGSLCLTALLARRLAGLSGSPSSFLAAAILASTFGFWDVGHRVVVDPALTFFLTLAFYFLAISLVEGKLLARHGLCIGAGVGCAFLAKGLVGPALLAPVAVYGLVRLGPRGRGGLPVFVASALAAFLVITVPWVLALYLRNPAYVEEILFHVGRRFIGGAHHNPTNFTFIHRSLLKLLPWAALLPFVLTYHSRIVWSHFRGTNREKPKAPGLSFNELLLAWFLFPVLLLLISRSKRELYLLPVFPAVALLTSLWLEGVVERVASGRALLKILWVLVVIVPVGGTLVRAIGCRGDSARGIGLTLESLRRNESAVVGYRLWEREEAAIAWYLRHPFENIEDPEAFASRVRELRPKVTVVGDRDDLQLLEAQSSDGCLEGARLFLEQKLRRRTLQVWVPDAEK